MSGVNKVILVGHVGKDPEVKYLEGGVALARFPLATSDSYKNKEGQKIETTEWHNVVVWRGLAEIVELIYIEGKIKTRQYGDENNKKYITEIVAEEMTMLGGPRTDNPEPAASTQSTPEMAVTSAPSDDLPF